ncbi:MAG: rRNA maturation RNase YbeY [Flavobacteriaceae bacterium]|nr:rRNA maturation RNase YbeY [Flavobacteriaceae bacterium]
MIIYNSENEFLLENKNKLSKWIEFTLHQENKELGELNYIFCNDNYLLDINIKQLKHNTLTDIISFDYSLGDVISGDVFISIERVEENSLLFNNNFTDELHRVMIHGVMHYCGYKDKTDLEKKLMRSKEDYYLSLRTF